MCNGGVGVVCTRAYALTFCLDVCQLNLVVVHTGLHKSLIMLNHNEYESALYNNNNTQIRFIFEFEKMV